MSKNSPRAMTLKPQRRPVAASDLMNAEVVGAPPLPAPRLATSAERSTSSSRQVAAVVRSSRSGSVSDSKSRTRRTETNSSNSSSGGGGSSSSSSSGRPTRQSSTQRRALGAKSQSVMGLLEHQDHHHQQNAMPTAAPTSLNSSASSTPTRHARNADLQAVIGHVRGGGHKGDDDESSSSSSSSSSSDADRRHRRRSSSRRRRRREKETEFAERDLLPPLASIDGVAPTSHPLELSRASFAAAIVPIKPLGCGSYGVVMLVRHVPSGQLLAMKKMSKRRIMDYGHTDHILTEKAILSRIAHPFIIRLVDTFNDDHYVYIFSEFAQGGELFSRVRLGAITEAAAAFYVAEVALALKYLHKQHIVYRDVKPENVVLDAAGHVRLVDFGFAKRIVARSWSICGTIEYLAPEIIRGDGGSFASDWWGVGCMLFELVVGHSPFRAPKTAAVAPAIAVDVTADAPSSDEIKQTERLAVANRILAGRLDYPDSMSSACRDVCAGLLRSAADKRFEFRDLKRHPFFEHIDWTRLVAKQITPPWQPNVDDAEDVRYFNVPREDLLRFLKTQPGPKENDPFAKF